MMDVKMYLTCKQFVEKYAWPPIGGLRHLIFYASTNGFDKVIRRIGRRVLINEQEFAKWIEEQGTESKMLGGNA